VVAGEWWPPDYSGPPAVSIDEEIARGFGVGIGDTLTVNVLGREVTAEIRSLRFMDWRSLSINFVLVFDPNSLSGAPFNHIATARTTDRGELALFDAVTE
jgi:putative ABC transport system permease protein